MGSLYWQINDCWPVASWSGMDYYGRWKALHYFVRDAFKNIIVVPEIKNNSTTVSTVPDLEEAFEATMECTVMDLSGKVLWETSEAIEVSGNGSYQVYSINNKDIPGENNNKVLEVVLKTDDEVLTSNLLYYVVPKDTELLPADKLVKNLYLQSDGTEGFFSNNYFDMLPGREYTITFKAENVAETLKIQMISLIDSYL